MFCCQRGFPETPETSLHMPLSWILAGTKLMDNNSQEKMAFSTYSGYYEF